MMSKFVLTMLLAAALTAVVAVSGFSAPSILGSSGNIVTPNDTVLPVGTLSLGYHGISDFGGSDELVNFFAGNLGLAKNLEVGVGIEENGGSEVMLNAKYRVLAEGATRPSVTVGVLDAAAQFTDDPGWYILLSKNLTTTVEEVAGKASRPVRGGIGFGGGAVGGVFLSLDWTMAPKLSLLAEYISDSQLRSLNGEGSFNAGLRYALTNDFRIDLGTIDFEDLTFGVSYQTRKF